tara:strand:+ start:795 stop:1886 length:1092 start_codon:yes stop_codon:yes gene_type:complete
MKLGLRGYENLNRFVFYFVVYALITYPLFYFAYKFNLPKFGSSDIYHYLRMYQDPFNFSAADGPFVYRQLSAAIVHLVVKSGFYYDAQISFSDPNFSQRFYFAAILVNWVCLLIGSCFISTYFEKKKDGFDNKVLIILVFVIFFLTFSTLFHGLSESPDGVSVALVMGCYVAYKYKSVFIFGFLLFISIFQRELISPMFGTVILVTIAYKFYSRAPVERSLIWMFLFSILCSLTYLVIRMIVFPDVSGNHDNQISISDSLFYLTNTTFNLDFFRQVFLTQNFLILTLFLYFFFVPRVDRINDKILSADLRAVLSVFFCLVFLGLAAGIGNNIGRILMYGAPFYMALLFRCFQLINFDRKTLRS